VRDLAGVLFDLGGVVVDSPLHAIARYERDHGLAVHAINHAIMGSGPGGAWSRLERGEIELDDFYAPFEADCRAHGVAVDGMRMMAYIAEARAPRPRMLEAIRRIRGRGLRVGALTNNWKTERVGAHPLGEHFHVVVESAVVGLRKPDPAIYELACRELGVLPSRTAFLDDIGHNLKSARALGMTTIKVVEPDAALRELEAVLGFPLLD